MKNWLIRAICITPVLIGLALLVKWTLIEPETTTVLEFEIKVNRILKGDREI